jgi:predicted GIY-YIG superfamily endonuclease
MRILERYTTRGEAMHREAAIKARKKCAFIE